MFTATATSFQKALDKATELRTAERVTDHGNGKYSVLGSDNETFYWVHVISPDRWICDCPAGRAERCCYHLAGVHLFRMVQSMRESATPATPAPLKAPAKWFLYDYPHEAGYLEWVQAGRPDFLPA